MVDRNAAKATPAELRSPLQGMSPVMTVSSTGARRGVVLAEQPARTVVQIIARRGKASLTVAALRTHFGLAATEMPTRSQRDGLAVVWSGPGQWLLTATAADGPAIEIKAKAALADLASLSDQSHARVHLQVTGPSVRDALAKLVAIDLDAAIFSVGAVAMTGLAQIPIHIWRLDDGLEGAVFEIAGPQSYAASLWHHVVVAASEYGLDARPIVPMLS